MSARHLLGHAADEALGGEALRPAEVSAILDAVLAQLLPANVETRVDELRQHLALETKMANLTAAIEQGESSPPLIALLTERQQERERLVAEPESAETLQLDSRGPRRHGSPGAGLHRRVADAA